MPLQKKKECPVKIGCCPRENQVFLWGACFKKTPVAGISGALPSQVLEEEPLKLLECGCIDVQANTMLLLQMFLFGRESFQTQNIT